MLTRSALFDRTVDAGFQKRITRITATTPDGVVTNLTERDLSDGSISFDATSQARYTAALTLSPRDGMDLYARVSPPGTVWQIEHGFSYGNTPELVDAFYGHHTALPEKLQDRSLQVSLTDMWVKVDEARSVSVIAPSSGTRASVISGQVTAAVPGTTVTTLSSGGTFGGGTVWDRNRTDVIQSMITDGVLDAAFTPDGGFRIRDVPALTTSPVWTFRTGAQANISEGSRTRPFDRLYNTVVVSPSDPSQTWTRQVVPITSTTHERAIAKIGVVPFFYSSPTITTSAGAIAAGTQILSRLLSKTETVQLTVIGHPCLEPLDVVHLDKQATLSTSALEGDYFLYGSTLNLKDGTAAMSLRSTTQSDPAEV